MEGCALRGLNWVTDEGIWGETSGTLRVFRQLAAIWEDGEILLVLS